MGMHDGIVEPKLYGCEAWVMNVPERKRVEAVEMNCLRSKFEWRRIDRIPNVEIRRYGRKVCMREKKDQGVMRWFCYIKRMGDDRLVKRVSDSELKGVRRRARPRKCWMDGLKETLGRKGLNIQEARVCVQDRSEWRRICRGGASTCCW